MSKCFPLSVRAPADGRGSKRQDGRKSTYWITNPLSAPGFLGLLTTLSLGHSLTSPNLWAFSAERDRKDLILLHYSFSSAKCSA